MVNTASRIAGNQSCDVEPISKRSAPVTRELVCAVLITYFPDKDFVERAKRVAPQVACVVIIDNSASEQQGQFLARIAKNIGAHLILNNGNVGVAKALNQGALWALEQGYEWILTLDQDSVVTPHIVTSLVAICNAYSERFRLALVGSNYIQARSRKPFSEGCRGSDLAREVELVITSGSLVSLSAFKELGKFREEFFIDRVDHEYCLRAKTQGFRLLMSIEPLMEHPIGASIPCQLLWWQTETSNHAGVRRYFMARNQLAMAREYFASAPRSTLLGLLTFVKSIILMVVFEREVLSKLRFTIRGIWHGLCGDFAQNPLTSKS